MARRGVVSKFFVLCVLVLAAVGIYTLWDANRAQDAYSAAKRAADKAGKSIEAAKRAWR
jgi:hypothetical protein